MRKLQKVQLFGPPTSLPTHVFANDPYARKFSQSGSILHHNIYNFSNEVILNEPLDRHG